MTREIDFKAVIRTHPCELKWSIQEIGSGRETIFGQSGVDRLNAIRTLAKTRGAQVLLNSTDPSNASRVISYKVVLD